MLSCISQQCHVASACLHVPFCKQLGVSVTIYIAIARMHLVFVQRRISGKIVAIDRVILGVNWPARPALCQELAGKLTGNCPSSMRHLFDQLGGKGPAGMASCWRPAGMASCWRPAGVLLAWRLAGVLLASGRHGILLALCWPGRHATCLQLGSGASSLAFDRRDCSP